MVHYGSEWPIDNLNGFPMQMESPCLLDGPQVGEATSCIERSLLSEFHFDYSL